MPLRPKKSHLCCSTKSHPTWKPVSATLCRAAGGLAAPTWALPRVSFKRWAKMRLKKEQKGWRKSFLICPSVFNSYYLPSSGRVRNEWDITFFVSGEHRHHSHCSLWVESSGHELCLQGLIFSSWMSMQ